MNTDKPDDKSGKGIGAGKETPGQTPTPGQPSTAAGATTATPASPAGATAATATGIPHESASAIAMIKTLTAMAVSAPTAADRADAIDKIGQWASASPEAWGAAMQALQDLHGTAPVGTTGTASKRKRAICLAGGGPAVGLHIGALEALQRRGIDFGTPNSVWALSCIGAWVGVVYNQAKRGSEIEETYKFFHNVFRDDKSFESFPSNTIFAPDWAGCAEAAWNFLLEPKHYRNAFLPRHIMESLVHTLAFVGDRKNWGKFNEGDFNRWTLNHVLAVHPGVRFLTALLYKAEIDGRTRLHYKDSKFLKDVRFEELNKPGKPHLFHNAFNFTKQDIDIFTNKPGQAGSYGHKTITPQSLCACSALPFVEQTVQVDGHAYCEGALIDTVNFKRLLEDHHSNDQPLEEIWINRIVDVRQIRKPKNLHDALANLCQMFAATVGEDDIKLFKLHVKENNRLPEDKRKAPKWEGTIVEIQVDDQIDFHWDHANLDRGRANGARQAEYAHRLYEKYKDDPALRRPGEPLIIPDDLEPKHFEAAGVPVPPKKQREFESR